MRDRVGIRDASRKGGVSLKMWDRRQLSPKEWDFSISLNIQGNIWIVSYAVRRVSYDANCRKRTGEGRKTESWGVSSGRGERVKDERLQGKKPAEALFMSRRKETRREVKGGHKKNWHRFCCCRAESSAVTTEGNASENG